MKHIIIPARLESKRFPEKILFKMNNGRTIMEEVYRNALKAGFDSVSIATDSFKIQEIAKSFGANVCRTKLSHSSGTSRIAEAVDTLGIHDGDIIVNLQCDEPFMPISNIKQVASLIKDHPTNVVGTLYENVYQKNVILDPNCVKVIFNRNKEALYFSRSPIPWSLSLNLKDVLVKGYYRHIGIYSFRSIFVKKYASMSISFAEECESLEQLRILHAGYKIFLERSIEKTKMSINTMSDLESLEDVI